MALKKIVNLPIGMAVEYWRLVCLNIDFHNKQAHVRFDGYINKAARLNGSFPVEKRTVFIENSMVTLKNGSEGVKLDFDDVFQNNHQDTRRSVYEYVVSCDNDFSLEAEEV